MIKLPFKISFPKFKISLQSCLGVDIGTSVIKVISLGKSGGKVKLENYGGALSQSLDEKPLRTFEENTLFLSTSEIARTIKDILTESKIKERTAVFSIPDFSSFFTNFELPSMTKKEIPQAIQFEAPQHIPLPLSEVTIDWQIINGEALNKKGTKIKILLVAVPNEIINQYREIARISELELQGLEAEAFSFLRAVMNSFGDKESKSVISIIDIGAQSTTCSIIDRGVLQLSHSFDIAGNEITQILASGLSIDYNRAEELKKEYGLMPPAKFPENSPFPPEVKNPDEVIRIIAPTIDLILLETERIFQNFQRIENKKIQKIILAGGISLMPDLREHFASHFKIDTEIVGPFANIIYPPVLEYSLKEMGPAYVIAIGAALRGLQQP